MVSNNLPDSSDGIKINTKMCSNIHQSLNEIEEKLSDSELINNQDCYWSDVDSTNGIMNSSTNNHETYSKLQESPLCNNHELHNLSKLKEIESNFLGHSSPNDIARNEKSHTDITFKDSNSFMSGKQEISDKIPAVHLYKEQSNLLINSNTNYGEIYDDNNIVTNNNFEPILIQSQENIEITNYQSVSCSVDKSTTVMSSQTISLITSVINNSYDTTTRNYPSESQPDNFPINPYQIQDGNFDTSTYNNQPQNPYNIPFSADQTNMPYLKPDSSLMNPKTFEHGQQWTEINNNVQYPNGYPTYNCSDYPTPHSTSNFEEYPSNNIAYSGSSLPQPSYFSHIPESQGPGIPNNQQFNCQSHNEGSYYSPHTNYQSTALNMCQDSSINQPYNCQSHNEGSHYVPHGNYQPAPPNNYPGSSTSDGPYQQPPVTDKRNELPPNNMVPEIAPLETSQTKIGENSNLLIDPENENSTIPSIINQIVALTPGGQIYKIDPLQDAPTTFKRKSDEVNWFIASYLNSKKTKFEIQEKLYFPESLDQSKEELFVSLQNKEMEKMKEWASKPNPFLKHDLRFLEKEYWLWELTKGLMQNLISDTEVALSSLNILQSFEVSPTSIERNPHVLKCLKRVMNSLKGDIPSKAKELFEKLEDSYKKSGKGTLTDNIINKLSKAQEQHKNSQLTFEWIFLREHNNSVKQKRGTTSRVNKPIKPTSTSEPHLNESSTNSLLCAPTSPRSTSPIVTSTSDLLPLASAEVDSSNLKNSSSAIQNLDASSSEPQNPIASTSTITEPNGPEEYEADSPYASPKLVICSTPERE